MATERFVRVLDFPVANGLTSGDQVLCLVTVNNITNTCLVTLEHFLGNTTANLVASNNYVPLNSTDAGRPGQISWDASYLYIAIGSNSWKRIPLSSF